MVRVTLTKIQEYTLQKGCPIPIHKLLYIVDKGGEGKGNFCYDSLWLWHP